MIALTNLRAIFEPFNTSRTIIGFDTFEGFPHLSENDSLGDATWKRGGYSSKKNYEDELQTTASFAQGGCSHEPHQEAPAFKLRHLQHIPTLTRRESTRQHFHGDLWNGPVRAYRGCSKIITPRLTKGLVQVFDELNCEHFPGATIALRKTLGTQNQSLRRAPLQAYST